MSNRRHQLTGWLQKTAVGFLALAVCGCAVSANTAQKQMSASAKLTAGWKIPFDGSASSPVLVGGVLYVGSRNGAVYAFDPKSGAINWRFQTGEGLVSGSEIITVRPGASVDEMIAAASSRKPQGKREVDATPVVENGTVYIGSKDYSFYAIDAATGHKKWSFQTGGAIYDKAVTSGDTLLFTSADGFLYAVDAITGQKKWAFETLAGMRAGEKRLPNAPVIADGVVYLTTWPTHMVNTPAKSFLYAIDVASGLAKWTVSVDGNDPSRPSSTSDLVFFSIKEDSGFVTLRAIDVSSGKMKWQFHAEGKFGSPTPAIAVRDMVIFGTDRGLFAVDLETGSPRWSRVGDELPIFLISNRDWYQWLQADDHLIYITTQKGSIVGGTVRGTLRALDQITGKDKWTFTPGGLFGLGGGTVAIAAIQADTIYVLANRYLYSLHRDTGKEMWSFKAETATYALPLIANGMVLIPGITMTYFGKPPDQGYFYAIDAKTGKLRP